MINILKSRTTRTIATATAFGVIALTASTAIANTSDSMGVEGTILQEIAINILTDLNFGTVARPHTGTVTLEVQADGSAELVGTDGAARYDDHVAGQFEITGEANRNVQFDHSITDFVDAGLSLAQAYFSQAESTNLDLGIDGKVVIDVGGQFTIASTAGLGLHDDASITINVWYD